MLELLLRVWGPVAILIYVFSATGLSATPLHAFDGITIPLAVLAVKGVTQTSLRTLPRGRLVAAGVIALGVIPANAYALATAHEFVDPAGGNANFITHDEHAALHYLAKNPDPGGVLTQFYLGEAVPGATGRRTFVGNCLWSEPNCMPRSAAADALFRGQDTRAQARALVRQSGARFLLASCTAHADLRRDAGRARRLHHPLRLRHRVRAGPARCGGGSFGRITDPCGCSRSEAPIASRPTSRARSWRGRAF